MPKTDTKSTKKTARSKNYTYAVGRRKVATARVRLYAKKGDLTVNGQPITSYFPGPIAEKKYLEPLQITGTDTKFSFSAKVEGSGKHAQLGAVIHGLSRALAKHNPDDFRIPLKKRGLLTRDPRMKETRKVGTGGKARRKKSSPKR